MKSIIVAASLGCALLVGCDQSLRPHDGLPMCAASDLHASSNRNNLKMPIHDLANGVASKADLVSFIEALARDLKEKPAEWENDTLERYLASLARWLQDSAGYYRNRGVPEPTVPSWKSLAEMLMAAKMYE